LSLLCSPVRPSSYLLNLSSVVDVDNKCSFRQGLVDQGISRSYWKVQGHSEHLKEKIKFWHFILNCQRYWHEIFRNIYRVLQSIHVYTIHMVPPSRNGK
jgi:hypothetical protein